jgi:hypothetical protein
VPEQHVPDHRKLRTGYQQAPEVRMMVLGVTEQSMHLESPCVLTLPDMGVALGVKLEIELPFPNPVFERIERVMVKRTPNGHDDEATEVVREIGELSKFKEVTRDFEVPRRHWSV